MGLYPRTFVIKAKYIPASAHPTTHPHTHAYGHTHETAVLFPSTPAAAIFWILGWRIQKITGWVFISSEFLVMVRSEATCTQRRADVCCTQYILMSAEMMWWCCPAVFLHSLGLALRSLPACHLSPVFPPPPFSLPHPYCFQHLSHF